MAVVRKRVCDVMQARGQEVTATKKVKITIPAAASDNGRPYKVEVDVSGQGERALEKMIRDAEENTRKAWAPLTALKPRRSRGGAAAEGAEEDDQGDQGDQGGLDSPQGVEGGQQQTPADQGGYGQA